MITHSFQPDNNATCSAPLAMQQRSRRFAKSLASSWRVRSRQAFLLFLLPLALVISCWTWGRAQTLTPHVHLVDVDDDKYPAITAYVSVIGANGLPSSTLTANDLAIWEDGKLLDPTTEIQAARVSALPLNLVVVLDTSTRDPSKWAIVRQAVHGFIDTLNPQDIFATLIYTNTVSQLHGFSTERSEAHRLLNTVVDPPLYSAFNDALEAGVATANDGIAGRKAVIMIIDRLDNVGRVRACEFNPPSASAAQQARPVPVYIFAYDTCALEPQQRKTIEQIAQAQGGKAFFFASAAEIEQTLVTLPLLLRQGYQTRYASNKPADGQFHGLAVGLRDVSGSESPAHNFRANNRGIAMAINNAAALATVSGAVPIDLSIDAPAMLKQVVMGVDATRLYTVAGELKGALLWDSATTALGSHTLWFTATDVVGNKGSVSATVTVAAPLAIEEVAVQVCPPAHEQDDSTAAACTNGLPATIAYGSVIAVTVMASGVYVPTQASLHFLPPKATPSTPEKPLLTLATDARPSGNGSRFQFAFTNNGRLLRADDYQLVVEVRSPGSFQGNIAQRTQAIGVTALRMPPPSCSYWKTPLTCVRPWPAWVHYALALFLALLFLMLLWPFWRAFLRWQRRGWYAGYLITLTNQGNYATAYEIQVRSEAPLLRFAFLLHGKVLVPPASNRHASPATDTASVNNTVDHHQLPSVVASSPSVNGHGTNGVTNGHAANGYQVEKQAAANSTGQKTSTTGPQSTLDSLLTPMSEGAQLLSGVQRYLPREVAAPMGRLSGSLRSWHGRLRRGHQDVQKVQRSVTKLTGKSAAWFELTPLKSSTVRRVAVTRQEQVAGTSQRTARAPSMATAPRAQSGQPIPSANDYDLGAPLFVPTSSALSTGWTATPIFRPSDEEKIHLLITADRRPRIKKIVLTIQSRPTGALCDASSMEQKEEITLKRADWRRQRA